VPDLGREPGFACPVNLSDSAVPLPDHDRLLLASGSVDDLLPPDTAVWLHTR
jgi:alpha-glucosidase